ncbi:hypothetical protein GCM10022279_32670 [Comamonas faecalis]|uniref:DUF1302 domain-containing protein n=1 Tax=Comamonas faecalis TaxID=1387849 RepID=A0ABP7S3N1_9BURK
MIKNQQRGLVGLAVLSALACTQAWAGTEPIYFGDGYKLDWRLNTTYALSVRTKNPDALLTSPANSGGNDGDRAFRKGDLTANRVSALFESTISKGDSGFVFSGSTFYDAVYHHRNAVTGLVNHPGPVNEYTDAARRYHGGYSRVLDAYAYTSFDLGSSSRATLRVGRHAVNWGESLFFPNIAMAQGPFDGTKTGVPGTETKDSILAEDQISGSIAVTPRWSLLGQVQFNFHPTLATAPGTFMSTSDGVGPGGICLESWDPGTNQCGFGLRQGDIKPGNTGQWGIGTRYRVTDDTEVGLYYLNYHDRTPLPVINFGDETYRIRYFDNVKLLGSTVSTTFGPVSAYGEFTYRRGAPVVVGDYGTPTRSNIGQLNLGAFYNIGRTSFADSVLFLGEVSAVKIGKIQSRAPIAPAGYEAYFPSSDSPTFRTKSGLAFTGTLVLDYLSIAEGWDLSVPLSYSHQLRGHTLLGGVGGQGDRRYSVGLSFVKNDNLTFDITYVGNIGKASLDPRYERLETDRDQLSVSVKYDF